MKNMHTRLIATAALLCTAIPALPQQQFSQQTIWVSATDAAVSGTRIIHRNTQPQAYHLYHLNLKELKHQLAAAPLRGQSDEQPVTLQFPNSSGKLEQFKAYESPVLHPDLAAKYPMIKTYVAQGVQDPTAYMRFSVTQFGLHAFTLSGQRSTTYIDPYTEDRQYYIVYDRDSISRDPNEFQCLMGTASVPASLQKSISGGLKAKATNDQLFRTFRLALSCTAEYGNVFANNGTELADILAAMAVTMNRVNGVYEIDLAVTMQLVSNNDQIIYWGDTNADPWTSEWNNTTQNEIDSKIGNANYDIGHNFNTQGGGNAGCISCVCTSGQKGSGYTGRTNPWGDPFDIDYVAHEMGHQFGGYHTMNTCSRSGSGQTEVEPASGSSIMGYAGICGTNVQMNSDAHFNYVNIRDISDNIQTGNSTCGAQTTLTNNPPVADAGPDFTIPQGTAFVLEGAATDLDGLGSLSYNWSQNDPEQAATNGSPESTWALGPLYRAKLPIASPDRYMPQLSDVIAGNLSPTWEMTPTVGRNMEFSFVVRDNDLGGPQEHDDLMQVTVIGSAGPFVVTSQGTAVTWNAGGTETVTWNVANTSTGSVNTPNVDIFLSTDGGYTYPITIASGVPNNGSASVSVPTGASTNTGRIMVRGAGNIFFDINDADIIIVDSEFAMNFSGATAGVCPPDTVLFDFIYNTFLGFNDTTVFSSSGQPLGSVVSFTPPSAVNDGTPVQMAVTGLTGAMAGSYTLVITGTAPSVVKTQQVLLNVSNPNPGTATLALPADGATGVPIPAAFSWSAVPGTGILYIIEIAEDSGFSVISDSATALSVNSFSSALLASNTTYYWRVTAYNACGSTSASTMFSFTTNSCTTYMSADVPVVIPQNGTPTVTSDLSIPLTDLVTDVNVVSLAGTHTWISDLVVTLQSPAGTQVVLFDQVCNSENNFDLGFDDQATPGPLPCPPVGGGTYLPQDSLALFNGEVAVGTWMLTIEDVYNNDGGSLNSWGLEVCTAPPVPCYNPDSVTVTFSDDTICSGETVTLSIQGNLNSATAWKVYENSCGGTLAGTGTSVSVSPVSSTMYYVRGEGGCVVPGACVAEGVVVKPVYSGTASAAICDGSVYTFPDGDTSSAAAVHTSVLTGINGCDSSITTTLAVMPAYSFSESASICGGVVYTFPDGDTSTTATVHTSFLSTVGGCDSVITTTLTEDSAYYTGVFSTICPGDVYMFPDGSTAGTDTMQLSILPSIGGCDSLVTTTLTIAPAYDITENIAICSGISHTFPDGTSSGVSATHVSVLATSEGCDSLITTVLTVNPPLTSIVNVTICNGDVYTFPDGSTGSSTMVYASQLSTVDGCDSTVFTNLTVFNSSGTTENVSICAGDTYTFPDGFTSTAATTHTSNLVSVDGCDSMVTSILGITVVDTSVAQSGSVLFAAQANAYQWIDCSTELPLVGATSQSLFASASGSYKVALTLNGCKDTSACRNVVVTGIAEDTFGEGLSVFPNPTSGHLTVDVGAVCETLNIQVTDMSGRLLFESETSGERNAALQLGELAEGLYFLRITADNEQVIVKLLIHHQEW